MSTLTTSTGTARADPRFATARNHSHLSWSGPGSMASPSRRRSTASPLRPWGSGCPWERTRRLHAVDRRRLHCGWPSPPPPPSTRRLHAVDRRRLHCGPARNVAEGARPRASRRRSTASPLRPALHRPVGPDRDLHAVDRRRLHCGNWATSSSHRAAPTSRRRSTASPLRHVGTPARGPRTRDLHAVDRRRLHCGGDVMGRRAYQLGFTPSIDGVSIAAPSPPRRGRRLRGFTPSIDGVSIAAPSTCQTWRGWAASRRRSTASPLRPLR